MNAPAPLTIDLTEYERASFPAGLIPYDLGERLWREYGEQIAVEFPSPKSDGRWRLTSLGWIGFIPLASELRLHLRPKVPLRNLFRMLEYAYRLRSFRFLDGLYECASIEEFYSELAALLARRVLDRERKGLYQEYVPERDRLPYLRGSLDLRATLSTPQSPTLLCDYDEPTFDIDDNRIIAYTLEQIARGGLSSERILPTVRRAYHRLQGLVRSERYDPDDCAGRRYNRLNDDYRALHALCRFFLAHSGPAHEHGEMSMLPFLVDMGKLFELFIDEWLRAHLPERLELRSQESIRFGRGTPLRFVIDILIVDADTGAARCVIDTKYKAPSSPDADDVAQVVAYAEATGCREAVLLYPMELPRPLDAMIGDVRVRSLPFRLDGNLEDAGRELMGRIVSG